MAKQDYVPAPDAQFSMWAGSFVASVDADGAAYGLTAEELTELKDLETNWDGKFAELFQRRDAAKAATSYKDDARQQYEAFIRQLAQKIQNDPAVTTQLKIDAGLPAHSTTRTPRPVPTTAPLASIVANNILEHSIRFSDSQNMQSRVRPDGVYGVEVWYFIGEQVPADYDEFVMYAVSSRMSTNVTFDGAQGGKTAYYRFRYLGARGQIGPWSTVYSSTILK